MDSFKETEDMLRNNRLNKIVNDFEKGNYKYVKVERQKKVSRKASNKKDTDLISKLKIVGATCVLGIGILSSQAVVDFVTASRGKDYANLPPYDPASIVYEMRNEGASPEEIYSRLMKNGVTPEDFYSVFREADKIEKAKGGK